MPNVIKPHNITNSTSNVTHHNIIYKPVIQVYIEGKCRTDLEYKNKNTTQLLLNYSATSSISFNTDSNHNFVYSPRMQYISLKRIKFYFVIQIKCW